jgi:hypothetical protein
MPNRRPHCLCYDQRTEGVLEYVRGMSKEEIEITPFLIDIERNIKAMALMCWCSPGTKIVDEPVQAGDAGAKRPNGFSQQLLFPFPDISSETFDRCGFLGHEIRQLRIRMAVLV